jgi:hypothetical protein
VKPGGQAGFICHWKGSEVLKNGSSDHFYRKALARSNKNPNRLEEQEEQTDQP